MAVYRPITKLKQNDVYAHNLVVRAVAKEIDPIFEVLREKEGANPEKHLVNALDALHEYGHSKTPTVDLTLFRPDTLIHGRPAAVMGFENIYQRGLRAIPVTTTAMDEGLTEALPVIVREHGRGLCIRLIADDVVGPAQSTLSFVLTLLELLKVEPTACDLLLDFAKLGRFEMEELVIASANLLHAFSRADIRFRSVSVSGSSLADFVTEVAEENSQGSVIRAELGIWLRVARNAPSDQNILFSDYGTVRPGHMDGLANKHMNGKVRYTRGRETHYFRGRSMDKTPLEEQFPAIAKRLVASQEYLGPNFSRGDRYYQNVADGHEMSASFGKWVQMDLNHHLVYTAQQILRLRQELAKPALSVDVLEAIAEGFAG